MKQKKLIFNILKLGPIVNYSPHFFDDIDTKFLKV
jgi:hypothetical protein